MSDTGYAPTPSMHAGYAIQFLGYRQAQSVPNTLIAIAKIDPALRGDINDFLLGVGSTEESAWADAVSRAKDYVNGNAESKA